MGQNFGSFMDTVLMGKINEDGWVAINILPTTAHTIWGVLCGMILYESSSHKERVRKLFLFGAAALLAGYMLEWFDITPIIKRIATSSFTLVSGGWVIWMLLLLYWIYDIVKLKSGAFFFVVIGMNPIFIYMFFQTVGAQWLNKTVAIFSNGAFGWILQSGQWLAVLASMVTLLVEWYLCYWLYKRKIFIKL